MTTGRPRLSQLSLWDRHVALILDVFRDALHLLAAQGARGTEPDLNRLLYECVLRANRNRRIAGLAALDTPVMWESRNQPSPTTASGTAENKIPDFQCGLIDHECPDPLLSAKAFVIECKRLGQPTKSWNFTERYVTDGMSRFIDVGWQYGKYVRAGAMVGYLEGIALRSVIADVNVAANSNAVPPVSLNGTSTAPLHELVHTLTRAFPESPFQLTHLWVETPGPPPAPAKKRPSKRNPKAPMASTP
ncbi:hypothetical protein BJ993_002018 [Nocardioides aromaticivorans]|uniref:Uncharacterized protein n=1 Tax=Nocardioides aromaticivorans TaxID=200618 RepID=A0A7Z0CN89_9ACTN|nr:hypothetical protein [Nocardioides aromaticivorans]NYI44938.1 hypothetical protein [Nocardioides aromaticivorans]